MCLPLFGTSAWQCGLIDPRQSLSRASATYLSPILLSRNGIQSIRAILLQYGRTLPKVIVCLKLKFRMQLENEDILRWQPGCEERVLSDFFVDYRSWPDSMTDMEVFERCRSIFNLLQRNETTADTIRRWTTSKIAEIAETLDSSIPGAHFDEESIRILTEDYFSPFLLPD